MNRYCMLNLQLGVSCFKDCCRDSCVVSRTIFSLSSTTVPRFGGNYTTFLTVLGRYNNRYLGNGISLDAVETHLAWGGTEVCYSFASFK